MAGAFSYGMTPINSPKGSAFQAVQETTISAGSIQMFAGSTAPNGWLICDGSTVSRKTYSDLFKAIGTTFGSGNSNDTFTLPDSRGRAPIGAGTGASLTARTLGTALGAETATLATTNLPSHTHTTSVSTESATHTHTGTSSDQSVTHTHSYNKPIGTTGSQVGIIDTLTGSSSGTPLTGGQSADHTHGTTFGNASATHSHSITNDPTGSGTAFGILLPAIAFNFIIKV
jgi:microcystin-dependent protein